MDMPRSKWWVLTAVACGTFMATLDSSIVNIALPTLTKELNCGLSQVKWVVVAYLLVITCLLLPFGRLADIKGRKEVFQLGFAVFTLGSVFAGMATTLGFLVAGRVVQALGAAMLMANGPAIITSAFGPTERGSALGTLAMVVSAGLISGPSLGGLLISHLGWRSIFWLNLPFGLLGILFVERFVPRDRPRMGLSQFDWVGSFLQAVVIFLFILLFDPPQLSISGGTALPIPRALVALLLGCFLAVFIKVEQQAEAPLFDLDLLRNRVFWTSNVASFLTFVSFSSISVLMPFFLEGVLGFPTARAGIFLTAIPLTILVVAPISGRLSDRLGSRGLSSAGSVVGVLALLAMAGAFGAGVDSEVSPMGLILGLSAVGLATGLFQSPNNNAIMGSVPPEKLGVASALLATVRNLGLVTGTGLSTSVFAWRLGQTGSDYVSALHFTLYLAAIIGGGAVIAGMGKRRAECVETFTDG